jgi:hypothetical protein
MLARSISRVEDQTCSKINQKIQQDIEQSVGYYRHHPEKRSDRLRQLDEEWDIERALETASSSLSLAGLALTILTRKKRYLILPLTVQSFFLQHALQGWCPPLPLFRKAGFRTQSEIQQERAAIEEMQKQ